MLNFRYKMAYKHNGLMGRKHTNKVYKEPITPKGTKPLTEK